ncbi:hypothetical protein Ahy_B08g090996 [Arachis hypogaea]|uniref:Ubiquitin-like protease family profile domain-containing protein n=1 Tax=Arachis hypogaea TaxID=3818 RepID=A0A444Y152_ARAHY|nr:hypothetical protein Ahy_B08g090996 [Arachis hypogaea]
MMVANVTLKKEFPASSFSRGFTQSSEEATYSKEDEPHAVKEKSQDSPILIEDLEELVEAVIDTGVAAALNFAREKSPSPEKNYTLLSHEGNFLHPKTKKPFQVEDYQDYLPFFDKKKLASYPFIFVLVCYVQHWWLWIADIEKKKFHVLDPISKKAPTKERTTINKFFDEVDQFRVEYASTILFDEMNRLRDKTIEECEAIRLSKLSATLLSPYCTLKSSNIDSR